MIPKYWLDFIDSHNLQGVSVSIGEDDDLSGVGAELQLLTESQSIDESSNCWPGIGVAKDGFVPVAWCSVGSGDYYYINSNDGPNGPLYRIYHDAVGPSGYDTGNAVDKVLTHYESVLHHVQR